MKTLRELNESLSDIVKEAGVAKGTFYLYFTDKYDIRNKLIAHQATMLLFDAYHSVTEHGITGFERQIIYMADFIIDRLDTDRSLLKFISKHLREDLICYSRKRKKRQVILKIKKMSMTKQQRQKQINHR